MKEEMVRRRRGEIPGQQSTKNTHDCWNSRNFPHHFLSSLSRLQAGLCHLDGGYLRSVSGWSLRARESPGEPPPCDPPLDVRGFHEGILTYHTMTHRYKEENER